MKSHPLLVLIISFWACSSHASGAEIYAFDGTCRNATTGDQGSLKLIFNEADNKIEGHMSIRGWLEGGGMVKGTREGNHFRLTSTDPASGIEIDWQGVLSDGFLSGEYFVRANERVPRQVGEWKAKLQVREQASPNQSASLFKEVLKLGVEVALNNPVKQPDGTIVSGAENIFRAAHPIGNGVSVSVEDVDIDWTTENEPRTLKDIHKFRVTYMLYWTGVVQATGWTQCRMTFNAKIDAITSHEILQTTGTTNKEFGEMAFGLGVLLGRAAVDRMLDSK